MQICLLYNIIYNIFFFVRRVRDRYTRDLYRGNKFPGTHKDGRLSSAAVRRGGPVDEFTDNIASGDLHNIRVPPRAKRAKSRVPGKTLRK